MTRGLSAQDVRRRRCYICREKFDRSTLFKAPCSHKFCPLCLQRFFRAALPEAKYPPKCCDTPIPDTANEYLPRDLVTVLEQKEIEYGIPAEQRVFCRGCAAIIPPWNIDDMAMTGFCEHCKDKTCIRCKTYKHEGECRLQTTAGELLKMSLSNNWATCYRCQATVEKIDECDHISCVCGAEFCYQCSAKWKTCACYHHEFLFDGETNANFRAAHSEITSESQIDGPGVAGEAAQVHEREEAVASVQDVDMEMETEQEERSHQFADVDMMEVDGHNTINLSRTSEMEMEKQEATDEQSTRNGIEKELPPDQATAIEPGPELPQRFRRPHVSIQGTEAAEIIEATQVALALQAPKAGPQFPKRNWACLHKDYYAIHHGGPFNCADCPVIQSTYILQCKKCKLHLCVRCAELYKDFDWWRDGPPRGRSKAYRSQVVQEKD